MTATKNLTKDMLPSNEDMVKNILTWYALSKSGVKFEEDSEWYQTVHRECVALSKLLDVELNTFIDVVAAVSPGMDWGRNIYAAEMVVRVWQQFATTEERHEKYLSFHTGIAHGWRNYDNAWAILDGEGALKASAQKTFAFGDNIRKPQSTQLVTIDQHMIHIICNTGLRGSIGPGSHYGKLAKAMQQAANIVGMPMHKLQAAVWCCRVDLFKAGYDVAQLETLLSEYGLE